MTTIESNPAPGPVKKQLTIKVFGVGGCGGNVVSHIARAGFSGTQLIVLNTDSQALSQCPLPHKFNLGLKLNGGLGAGGDPERGRAAAEEDEARLRELCTGVDMVFICAGLGGGTGTGAGPVLARVAKECGALSLAFVTLPFDCEGPKRMRQARLGLEEFKAAADGVIANKPDAQGRACALASVPGQVARVQLGGTVANGALLEADANGKAVTQSSGKILAKALSAGVANDIIPALLILMR